MIDKKYPTIRIHDASGKPIADFEITPCGDEEVTLTLTNDALPRCRSRKRLIKLLCGWFGIQRGAAQQIAALVKRHGSYQNLWEDAYIFMVNYAISNMVKRHHETPADNPARGSE